jgi:hypothetical protein
MAVALAGCSPHSSGASCAVGSTDAGAGPAAYDGSYEVPLGPTYTAVLSGCGGPGYAAPFQLGGQTYQLTIDTGSGTLAVASSTCTNCGVTPGYVPGPAATDDMQQVSDMYVGGSWQGEAYTESVQIGSVVPVNMKIASIQSQMGFIDQKGCGLGTVPFAPQGIVGFGPADLAVAGTDAFVTKAIAAGGFPYFFAIEVCPQGGQLMLGGVDPAIAGLTGPAVYTPMTMSSYYNVVLNDLRFGGSSLNFGTSAFGDVAVDTGTSVLALPPAAFQALVSAIEGNTAYSTAFDNKRGWLGTTTCVTSSLTPAQMDAQLPALTFEFPSMDGVGMTELTLKATQSYLPPTVSQGSTFYCSGIYSNPLGSGTILGTSVMLSQMVVFDLAGSRIGFAPQAYCH